MWCIWNNRNAAKFEGKTKQAEEIVSKANALVEDFKEQLEALRQRAPLRTVGWTPPCEGWYKVNVDDAVFKESGSYGIGIIRNERGFLMGVMSKKMDLPLGALEVEAKAFEEGILLASCCSPPSSIQMIIEGFQRWKFNVNAWQVNHVCRTSNIAAL